MPMDGRSNNLSTNPADDGKIEPSPTGANKFLVRGFKSRQKLMNHWQNGRTHREEYPELSTAEEYEQKALKLLEMPVGGDILGHIDRYGNIIRYNSKTNDFAKGNPLKGILTLMRPELGIIYYEKMKRGDLDNGGRD